MTDDIERLANRIVEQRLVDRIADRVVELEHPKEEETTPPWLASQLTREDLATMTPEQVDAAEKAGDLDQVLGRMNSADRELIQRAKQAQAITISEARHLAAIGHGELVASLPVHLITKDN